MSSFLSDPVQNGVGKPGVPNAIELGKEIEETNGSPKEEPIAEETPSSRANDGPEKMDKYKWGVYDMTYKLRSKPRIKLLYQTPEIYETDIGKWLTMSDALKIQAKAPGFKKGSMWACHNWDGRLAIGHKPPMKTIHPKIIFNTGDIKWVKVHLEDVTPGPQQGTVYWHATYDLPIVSQPLQRLKGRAELGNYAVAKEVKDVVDLDPTKSLPPKEDPKPPRDENYRPFRMPCVPPDDPTPHMFELSVSTNDGSYDDGRTMYDGLEGFDGFGKPNAHIGFHVVRMPRTQKSSEDGKTHLIPCFWKDASQTCARPSSPVHQESMFQRFMLDEEDPFFDSKDYSYGRGYYEYIFTPKARVKDGMKYLADYGQPSLYDLPRIPKYLQKTLNERLFGEKLGAYQRFYEFL